MANKLEQSMIDVMRQAMKTVDIAPLSETQVEWIVGEFGRRMAGGMKTAALFNAETVMDLLFQDVLHCTCGDNDSSILHYAGCELRCAGCGEDAKAGTPATHHVEGYCPECRTVAVSGGFTRAELSQAFNRVKDASNWKNPIEKFLSPMPSSHEQAAISEAITFYAGGGCKFQVLGPQKLRVTAPGYYRLIGA